MICRGLGLITGFTVLTTLASSCRAAEPLQCYKCFEDGVTGEHGPLPRCSRLRNAPEFKVHCPNSTMCVKEVYSIHLMNGSTRTTERRGCAKQLSVVQVLRGKFWEDVAVINEPYKEECMETPTSRQCYCRGDLCNSSTQLSNKNSLTKLVCAMFLLSNLRLITVI
ncbi:hypothetical protein KR093_003819 [Drosophila rubida]|uniref:Protein sleepless n=1 Tax=Drosophila rubida TaxID=30044 RepID=A0AAD4PKU5_9MUSC|nr:hypothetical protein KR093_003819 [Drosophila rubida]